MVFNGPSWTILWSNDMKISAFKGIATVNIGAKVVTNVETEFIIGNSLYWTLLMDMRLEFSQLVHLLFPQLQRFSSYAADLGKELNVNSVRLIRSTFSVSTELSTTLHYHPAIRTCLP